MPSCAICDRSIEDAPLTDARDRPRVSPPLRGRAPAAGRGRPGCSAILALVVVPAVVVWAG